MFYLGFQVLWFEKEIWIVYILEMKSITFDLFIYTYMYMILPMFFTYKKLHEKLLDCLDFSLKRITK